MASVVVVAVAVADASPRACSCSCSAETCSSVVRGPSSTSCCLRGAAAGDDPSAIPGPSLDGVANAVAAAAAAVDLYYYIA